MAKNGHRKGVRGEGFDEEGGGGRRKGNGQ